MRPWRYNGPAPDGWFCHDGVDCLVDPNNPYQAAGITAMIDREIQLAAQLGVATIRVEFDWPLLEPSQGTFDWSRSDYIVQEAAKYGIQLQPVLTYTPLWATGSLNNGTNWYEVPPAKDQYWTDFVTQIVSRYKSSIHYWELWNEPDGGTYWYSNVNPGVQDFVTHILNPGYSAVKAVDPNAKVIIGPDHADTTWYSTVVQDGGGNSFDIAAFHDYSNTALSGVQSIQSWLNSQGMGSKPIWIGEYGVDEGSNTTSDSQHQALMTTVLQGSGYQQAQWYTLRDELPRSCCPISGAEAKYFGVIQHDDVTLKQGFSSMRTLVAGLTGAPTATPLPPTTPSPATPGATALPTSTRTTPSVSVTATASATRTSLPTTSSTPIASPTAHATSVPSPTPKPPLRFSVAAVKVEWASSRLDPTLRRPSVSRVWVGQRVKLTTYISVQFVQGRIPVQNEIRITKAGNTVFVKHVAGIAPVGASRHMLALWTFYSGQRPGRFTFTSSVTIRGTRKRRSVAFTEILK